MVELSTSITIVHTYEKYWKNLAVFFHHSSFVWICKFFIVPIFECKTHSDVKYIYIYICSALLIYSHDAKNGRIKNNGNRYSINKLSMNSFSAQIRGPIKYWKYTYHCFGINSCQCCKWVTGRFFSISHTMFEFFLLHRIHI